MTTQDLTSLVAALQLAAVFFLKMIIQDLTSPVAANRLAAGFFCENGMVAHLASSNCNFIAMGQIGCPQAEEI